jgi:hypothetical protein
VRREVLAGLRAAPRSGTAAALGLGGCWAKTGTVPLGEGLTTQGYVLVLDDEGRATLARLDAGTGHEAAAALGRLGNAASSFSGGAAAVVTDRQVVVRLFDLLPGRTWRARNLGPAPIPFRGGFLGPGAETVLAPGAPLGPGLLELREPDSGLVRRLEGRLEVREGHLLATLSDREYVSGVLGAELPGGRRSMRVALGAAVLRFLAQGPRHGDADVCDSTHCAGFEGRGPHLDWSDPRHARPAAPGSAPPLDDGTWAAIREEARRPGPGQWTADCGGAPLSPHALWGNGDREAAPRHDAHHDPPWRRLWRREDLARAFGGEVLDLALAHPDGVWTLVVRSEGGTRPFRFDEAHRRLARVLGWDALPSPADAVEPTAEGFLAHGVGRGHRVGLCLRE